MREDVSYASFESIEEKVSNSEVQKILPKINCSEVEDEFKEYSMFFI